MLKVQLFHWLCQEIARHCPNSTAQTYARAGLSCYTDDEIKAQAPYILVNMTHWRGDRAKHCKMTLRSFM
jgi:hypothetical protein